MKLPALMLLKDSFFYMIKNYKISASFVGLNYLFMMMGAFLGGWTSPMFLISLALLYILWVAFIRIYFDKKPMFNLKTLGFSLVPSTKIFLIMLLFGLILMVLPYIFIYAGLPIDYLEQYIDGTHLLNGILVFMFLLFSPNLLFRPYFAWIGSVIDRNKSIRFAFFHTKGNYFKFFAIMLLINALMLIISAIFSFVWLEYAFISIIFTYFNVVLVKSYEFFFKV